MSDILKGLNDQQLDAVRNTVNQSALVLAGAGSGKTTVLSRRIAYLIQNNVSPKSMMAITFTNKASREMQERIANLIGKDDANKITMGTFHKICIMMLKQFGDRIGIDRKFQIADPSDQKDCMRKALENHNSSTGAQDIRQSLGMVSDLKNKMVTPDQYFQKISAGHYPQFEMTNYKIYKDYQDRLRKLNMLDFDDLLMEAVRLLQKNDQTRQYYQSRFQYVMVDEYQDTNPCQYQLIKLIAGKEMPTQQSPNNTFAVGDDYQAIYGFRGSDLQIILDFEKDFPEATVIKLEENYRSTKTVVHAGNMIMQGNKNQKHKTLFTSNNQGDKIKVGRHFKGEEEAKFVATEIQNLINFAGYKASDIAILYRTNFLSREIETRLLDKRIPYTIVGGVGFYERLEIKDTIAYLKVVVNPKDDIAMERILKMTPGIGDKTIDAMKHNALTMGWSLSESMKNFTPSRKTAKDGISVLRQLLQELFMIYKVSEAEERKDPVSKMLEIVWKRTGYKDNMKAKDKKERQSRLENLKELEGVAARYEADSLAPTLEDFLDGIILQSNANDDSPVDEVTLMTVHAAKGLEFPVVFVVGMNEGLFPHEISIKEDNVDEERRLAYVAITRAKEQLYMTYAKQRNTFNGSQWMEPSRFLKELPKEVIQQI